ncbi:MAG TPA: hypothetical protein VGA04_29765 [Streptosporangiaceae bacterium]
MRAGERPAVRPLPDEEPLRLAADTVPEVRRILAAATASRPDRET